MRVAVTSKIQLTGNKNKILFCPNRLC